ncbi:MAG: hypothetical protein COA45_04105 [Zetaproteobacteria bacterium]|nr:MAG: hypothetical protein COA45_04105 [Zetaproteobacteria bacterium]
MNSKPDNQVIIPPHIALRLLVFYAARKENENSWATIARDIKKRGHKYCFLIDHKKLRFWKTRGSVPKDQPYEAITDFILSDDFISVVPETLRYIDEESLAFNMGISLKGFFSYGFHLNKEYSFDFSKITGLYVQAEKTIGCLVGDDKSKIYSSSILITPSRDKRFAYINILQFRLMNISKIFSSKDIYSGYLFYDKNGSEEKIIVRVWNRFNKDNFESDFDFESISASLYDNSLDWPETMRRRTTKFYGWGAVQPKEYYNKAYSNRPNKLSFVNDKEKRRFSYHMKGEEEIDLDRKETVEMSDKFDFSFESLYFLFDKIKFSVVPKNDHG